MASVTAEGVHSSEQIAFLRANGCDEMEGELVSAPLPLDQLNALLKQDRQLDMQ
jgi:EAL domain-containing protein (putative c-di-GMP-specific phosphodiesterase class I)